MYGCSVRLLLSADCEFNLDVTRTRSLEVLHGRSDIPPFDELLRWKFTFLYTFMVAS
jgi:hypothetical protein